MKNNINKKIGATLLTAAVMTGTFITPIAKADAETVKPYVSGSAHVQYIGWMNFGENGIAGTTGAELRLEAIKDIKIENCENVDLTFDVHVQNIGWMYGLTQDQIVGTEGAELRLEAIVVHVNGNGLNDKGYKLQYRAHVQYLGWMDWVNEGQMAGTEGAALRMEAVEFRVVENMTAVKDNAVKDLSNTVNMNNYSEAQQAEIVKMLDEAKAAIEAESSKEAIDAIVEATKAKLNEVPTLEQEAEQELATAKTTMKDTLETYDAVLKEKLGKDNSNYKEMSEKIATAMENIGKAENIDDTKSIFDAIVEEVKTVQPNIEFLTEQATANKEEDKKEALEDLEGYSEVIANIADEDDKAFIGTLIEEAKKELNNAKTSQDIKDAMEKFEDTMSNFEYVRTKKAQNDAIEKLNGYLENASAGVKKEIEEAIDKINKAEKASEVEEELKDILDIVDPVLVAQEEAEDILKIYEESIASEKVGLTKAQQAVINNEISKIRETINNAKTDGEIKNIVQNFEDEYFKEGIYSAVKVDAEAKILQVAKDNAYKKLAEYENYDDDEIKQEVAKYKKAIDEKDTVEDIKKIMDDVKDGDGNITNKGALTKLKEMVEEIEADKENQQKFYKQAYDNVMEELNEVEIYMAEAQKQGKLSDDEVSEIKKMIQTTQTKLVNVSTAKEVYNARDAFEDYMINYYEEIAEFEFSYKKDKAIEKLNEYINSNASNEIKTIARNAKSQIEAITEYSKEVTAKIEGILNTAESDIASRKTAEAKAVAIAEITNNKAEIVASSEELEEDLIASLQAKIEKALTDIKNAETEKNVNKIYNDIMKEINEALGKQSPEEKLADYKQKKIDGMMDIKDLATDLNETALLNELGLTETAINEATTTQEVDELVKKMNDYVGRYYSELLEKKACIDELNNILEGTYPNDKKIQSIIEKAIRDVKVASTTERLKAIMTEVRGENQFTDADSVGGTVKARIDTVKTFETAKKTAIDKLKVTSNEENSKYVEYDETVKIMVQNAINKINSIQFEDYSDETYVTDFNKKAEDTLSAIKNYVDKDINKAKTEISNYGITDDEPMLVTSQSFYGVSSDVFDLSNENKSKLESDITNIKTNDTKDNFFNMATTSSAVDDLVVKAEIEIETKNADYYIENIKNSKTYTYLTTTSKSNLDTKINNDKESINGAKTFDEFNTKLDNVKLLLDTQIKELQEEDKEACEEKIVKDGKDITGRVKVDNDKLGSTMYSDFQTSVQVNVEENTITAALKKRDNWKEFGAPKNEASGYYLALKIENDENVADKITVKKSYKDSKNQQWKDDSKEVELDDDGVVVLFIPNDCIKDGKFVEDTLEIDINFYIKDKIINKVKFDKFNFTLDENAK